MLQPYRESATALSYKNFEIGPLTISCYLEVQTNSDGINSQY